MNKTILCLVVALLAVGCGKSDDSAPQPVVQPVPPPVLDNTTPRAEYGWLQAQVITPKCLKCHGGANPIVNHTTNQAIRLETYDEVMQYITAGNPDTSVLFKDINTGDMPRPKGNKLPDDQIAAFKAWILAGAVQTP